MAERMSLDPPDDDWRERIAERIAALPDVTLEVSLKPATDEELRRAIDESRQRISESN